MSISYSDLQRTIALLERGDWRGAHEIVQQDEDSPLSCWAHGIVHLLEGDLANARYWYAEARRAWPGAAAIPEEISALKLAAGIGRANR